MDQAQPRNQKCACGSGLKYKYCCLKRKQRFNFITYEPKPEHADENGVVSISLFIDDINGKLDVLHSETEESLLKDGSTLSIGYFRENGKPKILSEIPSNDGNHYTDLIRQVLKYDRILAIDTNTYTTSDEVISIGIAHQIFGVPIGYEYNFHYIPISRPFIIKGQTEKPENQNWVNFIKFLQNHKSHSPELKIGIIVDSDLGNIPTYNSRTKPIFEDYYLPSNFTLIFASDAAKDSFLNVAISKCHNLANEAYSEYRKQNIFFE